MSYSIKFNNCCSRVMCPDCGGVDKPAVGLHVIKGSDFDIVCDDCARLHAPELLWPLLMLGPDRWSVPPYPEDWPERADIYPQVSDHLI